MSFLTKVTVATDSQPLQDMFIYIILLKREQISTFIVWLLDMCLHLDMFIQSGLIVPVGGGGAKWFSQSHHDDLICSPGNVKDTQLKSNEGKIVSLILSHMFKCRTWSRCLGNMSRYKEKDNESNSTDLIAYLDCNNLKELKPYSQICESFRDRNA